MKFVSFSTCFALLKKDFATLQKVNGSRQCKCLCSGITLKLSLLSSLMTSIWSLKHFSFSRVWRLRHVEKSSFSSSSLSSLKISVMILTPFGMATIWVWLRYVFWWTRLTEESSSSPSCLQLTVWWFGSLWHFRLAVFMANWHIDSITGLKGLISWDCRYWWMLFGASWLLHCWDCIPDLNPCWLLSPTHTKWFAQEFSVWHEFGFCSNWFWQKFDLFQPGIGSCGEKFCWRLEKLPGTLLLILFGWVKSMMTVFRNGKSKEWIFKAKKIQWWLWPVHFVRLRFRYLHFNAINLIAMTRHSDYDRFYRLEVFFDHLYS